MSRYRKLDVRLWGDEKFRGLGATAPSAQFLWIYLLTGPHTTALPGLFSVGEAALAEALRWPLEPFRESFRKLSGKAMAEADWEARVVWIPRAIYYNEPANPNVVLGWHSLWDELPECALKDRAYVVMKQYFMGRKKAFREAFAKTFGAGLVNGSRNGSIDHFDLVSHQEQEQEQEQELGEVSPRTPLATSVAEAGEAAATIAQDVLFEGDEAASAKPGKARRRNELFDAVVAITGSDARSSATHIGRVCKMLKESEPPYTPAEVRLLPGLLEARGFQLPLTLGTVEKYIGWVRKQPVAAVLTPEQKRVEFERQLRLDREAFEKLGKGSEQGGSE